MDRPEISVVLPAWNAAPTLAAAVAGLQAQTRPVSQIVIVDDGSTDGTADLLRGLAADDPRIEPVFQANAGAAAARNAALARVRGEFVLFHDADDRLQPHAAATLACALEADATLDMAFGGCRYIDATDIPTGVVARPDAARLDARALLATNPIHTGTGVMLRARAVDRAGGFDTSLRSYIDLDYWLRAAQGGGACIAALDDVLVDYRRHPGQITGDWRRMRDNWARIEAKHASLAATLTRPEARTLAARHALFWAAVAYDAGDHAAARRQALRTWTAAPGHALRTPEAWLRAGACLATLLPRPLHDRLRDGWNARRAEASDAETRRDSSA